MAISFQRKKQTMSKLKAVIKKIQSVDSLNIVTFDFFGTDLTMMSLELNENIVVGRRVILGIKPTAVVIAKAFKGEISTSNHIQASISSIEIGELLCAIELMTNNAYFESIITAQSAKRLHLQIGDSVTALIKASEISISEVIND